MQGPKSVASYWQNSARTHESASGFSAILITDFREKTRQVFDGMAPGQKLKRRDLDLDTRTKTVTLPKWTKNKNESLYQTIRLNWNES